MAKRIDADLADTSPKTSARQRSPKAWRFVTALRFLLFPAILSLVLLCSSNRGRAGLQLEPDSDATCTDVSLMRGLKYGEHAQNVLNIAYPKDELARPKPIVLMIAGSQFQNEGTLFDWSQRLTMICLAARNGFVGVAMSYRRAPASKWPAGTQDVASAAAWTKANADLFGGDPDRIIAVGYSVGAFHLATYIAHPEFRAPDPEIAGAVLLSGIYRSHADVTPDERSYFGDDASLKHERSVFPGILTTGLPLLLAWSALDPQHLIIQAGELNQELCSAGHCPRTAVLNGRSTPQAVFDFGGPANDFAERARKLFAQIDARGLP